MLTIMKFHILQRLKDASFLFMAVITLLAFFVNGLIFSVQYREKLASWQKAAHETADLLEPQAEDLQLISNFEQTMLKPPSPFAFIAGGEEERIPNSIKVNAFRYQDTDIMTRNNEMIPVLPSFDWIFIIGTLMTLLAVFLSYDAICGEKKSGTLRQVLSNPVSRLIMFAGKYFGLVIVLVTTMLLGAAISLTIMFFSGAVNVNVESIEIIVSALFISMLILSLAILSGMMISSLVHSPATSLVILLVIWIIQILAIPGIAWLASEHIVKVPSVFELQQEMKAASEEIWANQPEGAQSLSGDLFEENLVWYTNGNNEVLARHQLIRNSAINAQSRQVELTQNIASISPSSLLDTSFQKLCSSGVYGFKDFYNRARDYKRELLNFTKEKDREDTNTRQPHLISSEGNRSYPGAFSTKPVDMRSFPKWVNWLSVAAQPGNHTFPLSGLLILVFENLLVATIGLVALLRYDVR